MSKYKWVWTADKFGKLWSVGINEDGSLHNPNSYPEDQVREAVEFADARRTERRQKSAAKGAATRKRRHELKISKVREGLAIGRVYGPSARCVCCGRGLSDPESRQRGIGPECWDGVFGSYEIAKAKSAEFAR